MNMRLRSCLVVVASSTDVWPVKMTTDSHLSHSMKFCVHKYLVILYVLRARGEIG